MQTAVAPIRNAMSSGTTNELVDNSHPLMLSSQGYEVQLNSSFDAVDIDLTKENFSMLVTDDSDKELVPQIRSQATVVGQSGLRLTG